MKKGFALADILLFMIAVILAIAIAYLAITQEPETPQTEQEHCSWYANSSVQNLPAKCMKYYK